MIRTGLTLLAALTLIASTGCQTDPGIKAGWVAGEETSQVIASDADLRNKLRSGKPIVTPSSADKPLEVTVPIRLTRGSKPVPIQYRFSFFLSNGAPVDHEAAWRTAVLDPNVQEYLTGSSVDFFAADWNLEIRPTDDGSRRSPLNPLGLENPF
ncbi:hypothetical protein [Mucisphaera sp.]|uniref:hypothetical protein n=1 Tax=Mucisphaera sp. TaxID=2913024 RepID=UPI003D0F35A2